MVTLLLDKFKGGVNFEDRGDKTHISEEESQTWGKMLDFSLVGVAQNAYQILQANNVFENKDFLFADDFTDANGTNNTVNEASTTAIYDYESNSYKCKINGDGTNDTDNAESSFPVTNTQSSSYGYKITATSNCVLISVTKIGTSTATRVILKSDNNNSIATATFSGNIATFSSPQSLISGNNYRIEVDNNGSTYTSARNGSPSYPYIGVNIDFITGSVGGVDVSSDAFNIVSCVTQTGSFIDSKITCDSNTKTLLGTEETICIYADKETPTDTDITLDISDGTTTLLNQPFNEAIGLTGFSSGILNITFNLTTTDTSVTPVLKGYGGFIK